MINSNHYLPYSPPVAKETSLPCDIGEFYHLKKKKSSWAIVYFSFLSGSGKENTVSNPNEEEFQPNMEMVFLKTCFAI